MSNLIIPDKSKHQYVVGIDFGHGETSAAICELEWDKEAGQREGNVLDIFVDRKAGRKVIPSAICRVKGKIFIGDEAFEHMTDNEGIRVCFKQKPQSIDGQAEVLMIDYMRAVYARIRESEDRLTDTNHIVYIARPSGWQDEEAKELYRQMALRAGIPLSGLTSESRAAIFYAQHSPNVSFANEIAEGAIVFDLGSSTVDFTYLSDTDKPIDDGYNLGASIIDTIIYEEMILKSDEMKEFVSKYPEYAGALKFRARKFKEEVYGREYSKTVHDFELEQIIQPEEKAYDAYKAVRVKLKIQNLQELNDLIERKAHYITHLRDALLAFQQEKLSGKTINGVFLTGGASRMNFIHLMIAETLHLPEEKVKYDKDNPSLTISRGIAMLGVADAITGVLVTTLKESIPVFLSDEKMFERLLEALSSNISKEAWTAVQSACNDWVKHGQTTDRDELKKKIEESIKQFQRNRLSEVVNSAIQSFVKDESERIRKEMNKIISRYAPGQEISDIGNVSIGNQQAIVDSMASMTELIKAIDRSMGDIIADILWKVLGAVLWGLLVIPYYILKAVFTSDESKRKDKARDILKNKSKITFQVKTAIKINLASQQAFRDQVTGALSSYFSALIDVNLQKVIIPIE